MEQAGGKLSAHCSPSADEGYANMIRIFRAVFQSPAPDRPLPRAVTF